MMGVWNHLRQLLYTKFIAVVDDDVDVHSRPDAIWALTTRMDPARDKLLIERTPIDLDFAPPVAGLGSKMGGMPRTNGRAKRSANGSVPWPWMPRSARACTRWWMRWAFSRPVRWPLRSAAA